MDPLAQFRWSVRAVRLAFQINGQDIFRDVFRRSKWFYLFFGHMFLGVLFEVLVSMDTDHYDGSIRYMCALFACLGTQVSPQRYHFENA